MEQDADDSKAYTAPATNDSIFISGRDWHNNACVKYCHDHRASYADGYLRAGNAIVAEAMTDTGKLDTLVYPAVFAYRHYVELRLKHLASMATEVYGVPRVNDEQDHKLMPLWNGLSAALKSHGPGALPNKVFDALDRRINELSSIDPKSIAFRYAHDLKGRPSIKHLTNINVRNLCEVMNKIASVLDYLVVGLMGQVDVHREMMAEYLDW